jgi:diguanylate cyclase (GGDEF)-like protein
LGGAQAPHPPRVGTLGLLLGDFARVVGCQIVLVCERDGSGQGRVLSSWGIDADVMITIPNRGGRRGSRFSSSRGCFVGRALAHRRPAFEALDPGRDRAVIETSAVSLTHALAAPVQVLRDDTDRVLVAGFSTPPQDVDQAFWVAGSYAGLVGLIVSDLDAFGALEHARHDRLTGCLTYETVRQELIGEINRSARAALPLSCCFIDLDGFKLVNDRHGHLHGNAVLANFGLVLREAARSYDTVGRYGGDEFIVILPQTNKTEAGALAKRLRSLAAQRHAARFRGSLAASIGVAQWTPESTGDQLLAAADSALLAAKTLPGGVASYPANSAQAKSERASDEPRHTAFRSGVARTTSPHADLTSPESGSSYAESPALREAVPVAGELEIKLDRDANSPAAARRLLEEMFGAALSISELDTARLLVSELVTNAFLHGQGAITLCGELDERRLLVEVIDQGSGFQPANAGSNMEPTGGWGLGIVASESSRWGVPEGSSTRVWFELDRPDG